MADHSVLTARRTKIKSLDMYTTDHRCRPSNAVVPVFLFQTTEAGCMVSVTFSTAAGNEEIVLIGMEFIVRRVRSSLLRLYTSDMTI